MAKIYADDDSNDDFAQQLEAKGKGKPAITTKPAETKKTEEKQSTSQPIVKVQETKRVEEKSSTPVVNPISSVQSTTDRRNTDLSQPRKKGPQPGASKKGKNTNPLYSYRNIVNPKYLKNATTVPAVVISSFNDEFKMFAVKNKTTIGDLIAIAMYRFGIDEGFLTSPRIDSQEQA